MPALDGRVRRTELGTVRVTAAVGGVAVVPAQRRRVDVMAGGERGLAGRTVRVHGMNGRVGTGIGGQEIALGANQQRGVVVPVVLVVVVEFRLLVLEVHGQLLLLVVVDALGEQEISFQELGFHRNCLLFYWRCGGGGSSL